MKIKYTLILIPLLLIVIGCEDFLDRPPLTTANDETAWTSEDKLRLYANQFYPDFFVGYASGWTTGSSLLSYAD
ncbi:MAG: RagB/SusD family nutrient uptake outer membrane protein, partial [Dysgonamonadaceae bacterium]